MSAQPMDQDRLAGAQPRQAAYPSRSECKNLRMRKHLILLSILVVLSWGVCYFVAGRANCQTGRTIPTDVVVYRSVNRVLHLPFFWLPYDCYRVPNVIGGPGVYRKWYLILVALFWGCFLYALFPSIRKFRTKGCKRPRASHASREP